MNVTGTQILLSGGIVLLSVSLSGLVSYIVSNVNFRRFEKRKLKTETLRRLAAHRYVLTNVAKFQQNEEFFAALNEAFVVFQDAPKVMSALEIAKESSETSRFTEDLLKLFKVMCDDLGIDRSRLNDSFFLEPFTPNRGRGGPGEPDRAE